MNVKETLHGFNVGLMAKHGIDLNPQSFESEMARLSAKFEAVMPPKTEYVPMVNQETGD